MKKVIALFVTVLLVSAVFAGNKSEVAADVAKLPVKGIVIDKVTGETLTGVLIKIEDPNLNVYTDFDGEFNFNIAEGDYTFTSELVSYKTAHVTVKVSDETQMVKIELERK